MKMVGLGWRLRCGLGMKCVGKRSLSGQGRFKLVFVDDRGRFVFLGITTRIKFKFRHLYSPVKLGLLKIHNLKLKQLEQISILSFNCESK